jgi:hypothetical protein
MAPQQMLRTHRSLEAYCATLWYIWIIFPCNGAPVEWNWEGKTFPSATLSTTNLTRTDPGSNPGLRGGRTATNRLSHGTALTARLEKLSFIGYFGDKFIAAFLNLFYSTYVSDSAQRERKGGGGETRKLLRLHRCSFRFYKVNHSIPTTVQCTDF